MKKFCLEILWKFSLQRVHFRSWAFMNTITMEIFMNARVERSWNSLQRMFSWTLLNAYERNWTLNERVRERVKTRFDEDKRKRIGQCYFLEVNFLEVKYCIFCKELSGSKYCIFCKELSGSNYFQKVPCKKGNVTIWK